MSLTTKCLILGSGPAGYTAAIYAARAGLKPILIKGNQPGGQLTITTEVENYPGYAQGIMGPQMMQYFEKQALRFDTDVRSGMATAVNFKGPKHLVTIDDSYIIEADTVLISTGASAKWLGIPSETRLNGRGVSACAVCDGFFFRGLDVAIVGGGDSACEEASYLAKLCKTVHLLVRRNEMRASKIMQERVKSIPNIMIHWHSETNEILGQDAVEGLSIRDTRTGELREIAIQGFFVAIGHQPNTSIFKGILEMDEQEYLLTTKGSTHTNVAGVFACGDVQDRIYRQAVTAAGSGCMAALDAERYLAAKGIH
ncbi:MAG: thioredoxin-disulfide reductase [Cytophagales bacterium]|nr:MAG: thioredoxin-disulfide reductase [Cytophagales bacterium]